MRAAESAGEKELQFNEACHFIEVLVKAVGLHGEFLATPNYVQTILWGEDEGQQQVHLAVSRSGNYDLGKLDKVTKVAVQVERGLTKPDENLALIMKDGRIYKNTL